MLQNRLDLWKTFVINAERRRILQTTGDHCNIFKVLHKCMFGSEVTIASLTDRNCIYRCLTLLSPDHCDLTVPRTPPRDVQVYEPSPNSLSVRWLPASGQVQQYRVTYRPLTPGAGRSDSVSYIPPYKEGQVTASCRWIGSSTTRLVYMCKDCPLMRNLLISCLCSNIWKT